jgi:endo-1,4-beta-D-glucanase Y
MRVRASSLSWAATIVVFGCSPAGSGAGASGPLGPGDSGSGRDATGVGAEGGGGPSGDDGGSSAADGQTDSAVNDMGPTPPQKGVNYPFPQNRHYSRCTYPQYTNAVVRNAYATWKNTLVTTSGAKGYRRVQRSASESLPMHTVSEGIGYGMILAVYMNDQPLFDDLWNYEQQFLDSHGLMNWDIDPNGNVASAGAATDGDEDMAWALLMADKQWGTSPTLGTYLAIAQKQIGAVWNGDVYQSKLPNLGDSWGDWNSLDISYFAPAYYRVFAVVDPADDWAATVKTTYDTIANNLNATNGNQNNGLVPGFSSSQGGPPAQAGTANPFTYQYDACRTPFRIGLDWCVNGERRAQAYVALTSRFFGAIGATNMVDGYQLNGVEMGNAPASPFVGPAGVGAMSSASYSSFTQGAYELLLGNPLQGGEYYAESWTVLSLLMMSGNFLDYTNLP